MLKKVERRKVRVDEYSLTQEYSVQQYCLKKLKKTYIPDLPICFTDAAELCKLYKSHKILGPFFIYCFHIYFPFHVCEPSS